VIVWFPYLLKLCVCLCVCFIVCVGLFGLVVVALYLLVVICMFDIFCCLCSTCLRFLALFA